VKGVASLGNFPLPGQQQSQVKSIADFTDKDRIALPAVTVSVQSRVLQLAAAKQWGDKEFNRLDKWTVAVPHPMRRGDAGGTGNHNFGNPPFQEQELAGNRTRASCSIPTMCSAGPARPRCCTRPKIPQREPKAYRAFVDALAEAAQFATKNPEAAADLYIRVNKAKDRSRAAGEDPEEPAGPVQGDAAEHVPAGRLHASRGRHQEPAEVVAGLFLPGSGHRAGELTWPTAMHGSAPARGVSRSRCCRWTAYRWNIARRERWCAPRIA
jgi:hypothetical protein